MEVRNERVKKQRKGGGHKHTRRSRHKNGKDKQSDKLKIEKKMRREDRIESIDFDRMMERKSQVNI